MITFHLFLFSRSITKRLQPDVAPLQQKIGQVLYMVMNIFLIPGNVNDD